MANIDVTQLSPQEAYKILIGSVVPRPIAWVGTTGLSGVHNLAPFSFYTAVCSNPPTLLFCPVTPKTPPVKDTLQNIHDTGVFTVNVVSKPLVEKMNQTSAPYPPETSEFEAAGLTPVRGTTVAAARVLEALVSFECELDQVVKIGAGTGSGNIVIGRVVRAHIDDTVTDGALHIDIEKLQPVSRLAGSNYADVGEVFSLKRPMAEDI